MDLELAGELLAAAAGGFQGHQQGGAELGLGAVQLLLGHVVLDAAQFLQRHGDELGGLVLPRAGIDREHAAVPEGGVEGVDGIDEAALLADLLEQAGGHAATEQAGHQHGRVVHRVAIARAGEAQHDMDLIQLPLLAELAAGIAGGLGLVRLGYRQVGEVAADHLHQRLVLQRPGGGDHHAGGAVVPAHVVAQRVARHLLDDGGRAQGGAAHGLIAIGGGLEVVEDDVVGRVVGLPDLLQDHAALALHLLRREGGMGEDVAQDVGGERQVVLQHLGVVGGVLPRRVGVEVAADILDLPRDGGSVALLGALEGHVLQEVGHAVLLGAFVPGAGMDIGADRGGLHAGHGVGNDGQAVGEARQAHGIAHGFGRSSTRSGPGPVLGRACCLIRGQCRRGGPKLRPGRGRKG